MLLPILLTASVDTRGMKGAKFSAEERENMYVDTLNFYIRDFSRRKENFVLVFAENSGWSSASIMSKLLVAPNVKLEYIALKPELFLQEKGKSYNEMKLIDLVIERADCIKQAGAFFKVTGRYPILNLYKMIKETYNRGGIKMQFYCDCKDHRVYEWLHLPINGHMGECRYYAVSLDFYNKYLRGKYEELDDSKGKYVENLFLEVIRATKGYPGVHCRFRTQAHLTGAGGHSIGKGLAFFYSTDNDSCSQKCKRCIRQMLRWIMPWWKC